MNASFSSDSPRQAPANQGASPEVRQTPSVPISVYRELATELKATQAMVDSLTQQNRQLSQQNQMLRHEMLSFAESADRLRQAVEISQPQVPQAMAQNPVVAHHPVAGAESFAGIASPEDEQFAEPSQPTERFSESMGAGVSNLANHLTKLVTPKPKKEQPGPRPVAKRQPATGPQVLYTEERLEPSHSSQSSGGSADLSGLWLATTILLIVVSAFGAGFLIMKPLLNNSR